MVTVDLDSLPTDAAVLRDLVRDLVKERSSLLAQADLHEQERRQWQEQKARLEHLLGLREAALFGPRSERLSARQMELFAELIAQEKLHDAEAARQAEEAMQQVRVAGHARRRRGRRPIPQDLPRVETVIDLSEEEKKCPHCGAMRVRIGEEVSERLEFEPARLFVQRIVRPKCACPECCGHVQTAPLPPQPIDKGIAGAGLLALVATNKFADHLPLYRQEGIFARSGVDVPRSTMCDWLRQAADRLLPLAALLTTIIRAGRFVQSDDTPVRMMDAGRGTTLEARFWVYVGGNLLGTGPPAEGIPKLGDRLRKYVVFEFTRSREGKWPQAWLKDFKGVLQADAFSGYDQLYKTDRVVEAGCWGHARRKFRDARKTEPSRALYVMTLIQRLYTVERRAMEENLDAQDRLELRSEFSRPVLTLIRTWLDEQQPRLLPKSPLGEAVQYALNQWNALARYVDDADVEIDNNACERAIRAVAIGRKNWLFVGSEFGGETAATFFSLIASARLHEIEPWAYLRDVIRTMPTIDSHDTTRLAELLPHQWRLAHPEAHLPLNR